MINTLFSMHNIKYIISVDDCFFARKREDIEATIYSEMCTSLEPFRAILSSCNQTEIVDAIDEMMTVGADSTTLIQTLLGNLEEVDLLKCFDICEKNRATYAEERDIILAFLEGLKSEGQIIEYRTFSSTTEANLFDIKEAGMTDGAILWLLDRNFSRVGESEEAGLKFAENILKRENASQNYIYILSAVEPATGLTEDGIEEEFDKVLDGDFMRAEAEIEDFVGDEIVVFVQVPLGPALEHQASPPVCASTHRQNFSLGTTMRLPIRSAGKPVSCMSS